MAIQEQVYGFFIPSVTLIGIGASKEIPEKIKALGGGKPMLVTDKGVVAAGVCKQVTDLLDAASLPYVLYDKTVPNPTDKNIQEGVEAYRENGCDSLITLGGGSSHDCGKGVGIIIANGGKIHDYEGLDMTTKPLPPFLAVNTTAGTASEMTRFVVITDTTRHVKMVLADWRVTPGVAIDDPVLMVGMPPALTASTGMDALTHAVEAFVSPIATPMTDACAIEAVKLVSKHLRKATANGQDLEAREGMCFAQYLAGMAFNNAGVGYVHAMAHQLGGLYNLPHGECNALLLPHVERFNLIAKVEKFVELAEIMGENTAGLSPRDAAELAIKAIEQLSADVGIPTSLVELGKRYGKEVKASDIPTLTANAQKDICKFTNPRCATDEEISALYAGAM